MRSVVAGGLAAAAVFAAMAGVGRRVGGRAVRGGDPGRGARAPDGGASVPRGEPPPAPPDGAVEADPACPDTGPFPPPETEAAAATTTGPPAGLPAGLIAYTLDTGIATDVFVRRLDAPEERRVTTSPGADLEPDLSPDGTLVAYQGHLQPKSVESDIYVVGADGGGRSNLTRAPGLDNRAPGSRRTDSASPSARAAAEHPGAVDDGRRRQRRALLTRSRCEDADWSPDGTLLVCVGDAVGFGGKDLWLVSADNGEMRPLTTTVEPERGHVVAGRQPDRVPEARERQLDGHGRGAGQHGPPGDRPGHEPGLGARRHARLGGSVRPLAAAAAVRRPAPGARRPRGAAGLVGRMTSERAVIVGSITAILVVIAGAQLLGLARGEEDPAGVAADDVATEPAPTTTATAAGSLLAYSRDTADGEDVFLRDLASGEERRLTSGAAREFDPDLSPDGRLVAYRSNPDPASDAADIWVVGVDGSAPAQPHPRPSDDNWAPRGRPPGRCWRSRRWPTDRCCALDDGPDGSGSGT